MISAIRLALDGFEHEVSEGGGTVDGFGTAITEDEDMAVGNGNGTNIVFGTGWTVVVIEVVVEVVADVDVAIIAISHSCLELKIRYPEINN